MNMRANIPLISQISADIADMLGDDFDPDTFWDTLDGETDILDIADHIIRKMQEDAALAVASKAQADDLAKRAKRIGERANAHKAALLTLLDASGQKKLERPAATLSRRKGSVSVSIMDEREIPSQLMTIKTTAAPDKTAIKKQIEAGVDVPGAALVRGDDTVTVRVV